MRATHRLSLGALLLGMVAWCAPANAGVAFKIVTTDGFVTFSAEDHWPVISMKTKPPIAVAIFQIPNPADTGTSSASATWAMPA